MKRNLCKTFFTFTFLFALLSTAKAQDWGKFINSKDIVKVYTYKNSTTYALLKAGGLLVFDHATKKSKLYDSYNSPLPSNNLKDIAVTNDSILYIASDGAGLIKINRGVYEKIIPNNIWTSESMHSVTIAPNGDIWFSNNSFDVFKLDKNGIITTYSGTNGNTIGSFDDVKFTSTGKIWAVGVWGVAYFDGTQWTSSQPFFPSSYGHLVLDNNDIPYVTFTNGLMRYANNAWIQIYKPGGFSWPDKLLKLSNGLLLMSDFGSWATYNTATSEWADYSFQPKTTPNNGYVLNNNDQMWVSTANGYVLETSTGNLVFPYRKGATFEGQPTAFLEDSHGNLWIGSSSNGLSRLGKTDTLKYNYNHGFTDSQVYSLAEDKTGKVWIGGPNRLHYYLKDSIYQVKHSTFNYYAINDILIDDDNSLWGASNQGLFHITATDTVLYTTSNSPSPSNYLKRIEKDKLGNYWITSDMGMIKFDGKTNWFLYTPSNSGLVSTYINDTETDAFGNIWIGCMNYGNPSLCVWNGTEFLPFDIDPTANDQAHVMDISIDKYGNKWFSTQSHGYARFDGNSTTYFTTQNANLPTKYLYANTILGSGLHLIGAYDIIFTYKDPARYLDTTNVRGTVFHDLNTNGLKEANENLLPFARVKIWGSQQVLYTNAQGQFSTSLKPDDYLISPFESAKWKLAGTVLPVKVVTGVNLNIAIPFESLASVSEPEISISGGFPRCNTDVVHIVDVRNDGTKTQDAKVRLITQSPVVSSFPAPTFTLPDTLEWDIKGMTPGQETQLKAIITMPTFDATFKAQATVRFYDANGAFTSSKTDSIQPTIRCAYDPNDKSVNPTGLGKEKFLLIAKPVEYQIRFQNTGNDTAFNVTITDTLSPLLNYATLELLASSHKVQVSQQNDSVLVFSFKKILLPDSTTNEPASHGFATFRIQPKATVKEFSVLTNTANIYFDYNPAIVTNVTSNILVSKYPQNVLAIQAYSANSTSNALLYPNPVKDIMTLELKTGKAGTASIYNMEGVKLQSIEFDSTKTQISTSDLRSGVYTLKVETEQKTELIKFVK